MTTVIVQFQFDKVTTPAEAEAIFVERAPIFQKPEGLIRKYYLLGDDGRATGGVYLWATREQAEQFFGAGFRQMITERYGAAPTITFFHTPVVIDNVTGQVETASRSTA